MTLWKRKKEEHPKIRDEEDVTNQPKNDLQKFMSNKFVKLGGKVGLGVLTAGALYGFISLDYVKPNEWAIKQVSISPFGMLGEKGVREGNHEQGYHLVWFGLEKLLKIPKDVQNLSLHHSTEEDTETRFIRPAKIQTSDGFYVDLDATVLYNIVDPYKVITTVGAEKLYEDNGIIPKTEPALRATLGSLNPEDFYNAKLRVQGAKDAKHKLNGMIADKGMEVVELLIRDVTYDKAIQQKFEDRVLQQQLVFTNIAKTNEAKMEAILTDITEKGLAAEKVKLQEGTAYTTEILGQINLYERSKAAEGDLAIKLANGYSTEVVNKAYETKGSELLIGRELAKLYKGIERVLIPVGGSAFNPLDVKTFSKQYKASPVGGQN